jgi:predicted nucleic acid-binding protein
MVSMDTGYLGLLLHPKAKPPTDPATKKPLVRAQDRIEKLVNDLNASNERVIISTPVLCEFLVLVENAGQQYLAELSNQPGFRILPFDQMAAIELAAMELLARGKGGKRSPAASTTPWQKVKFDRQIVAIAKVHQAHTIYSDDADVKAIAENAGIKVVPCWELPLPPSDAPLFDNVPPPEPDKPVVSASDITKTGRKFRTDE